jgi:MoaA/NifB/PqqE/SkfB family radical SAM enzyme
MKNSLVYLTRRCPRNCEYCALRDAKGIGHELSTYEWIKAFAILKELGINFNLILGNETWLLGYELLEILRDNKVPYALYTTCPEPMFSKYKEEFFKSGIIDNLSCGIDYPILPGLEQVITDDSYKKSVDAWRGFQWIKEHYPKTDTQGTITVHRKNIKSVPILLDKLSKLGVFVGINFIHWNKDGKYDFFPMKEEIQDLLFKEEDYPKVAVILNKILNTSDSLLQNPEFIQEKIPVLLNMGWHCQGNPYGGPTIDADGHLRVCGYRRGRFTPKFTIFDLPKRCCDWKEAVYQDAMECPGCAWSYPWMYHFWEATDSSLGEKVFVQHAGRHIDKSKWSNRKIK